MAGSEDDILPPPSQTPTQQTPHTVSTIKLHILKKGEYDIWAMKMEHYLSHIDYPIWEVIQRGNGPVTVSTDTNEDQLAKFHKMTDAKEMWEAIKSRFGGNDESKKMQKYILKQQFEGFSVSNFEGLHKGYDTFQSLLSQLEIHGVDSLSFDDLYNNLRVFKSDVKGSTASSFSTQNVAFVSENTSSTNDTMEVFMDDFSVFRNSFSTCLSNLEKMLKRCEDTNLALNWEKSHFMVKEGIVLGHKISKKGIEVDKAKIDVIAKLPHPTTVKEECIQAFQTLKKKLTEAPILIAPNWDQPFELMCDASDYAIGAVLGQRIEKHFRPIHYAIKTITEAESNYTTTEKEMFAVVYAFEKFQSYLIMNKSIVYTDHSALKYLFAKKDAKARFLRWVLLL
ncbi:reverse transcriptase domain-containing protein [Tanacetum coccineum]